MEGNDPKDREALRALISSAILKAGAPFSAVITSGIIFSEATKHGWLSRRTLAVIAIDSLIALLGAVVFGSLLGYGIWLAGVRPRPPEER